MRLRFGVAMARKGGRSAIVGAEVTEARGPGGRLEHEFTIGHVDRVQPFTVEAAAERVAALVAPLAAERPCVLVDVGSPQGLALQRSMRDSYPAALHRPHAYRGTGDRVDLFAAFLGAYSKGRVRFRPGLKHRAELDRALVFYLGGGAKKDGVELASEDEALVVAIGLAMFWPKHGPEAAKAPDRPATMPA